MPPANLLTFLAGPDRRSIGRSPLAVRRVLRTPSFLPTLVRGLTVADPVVRMRAADALEKLAHHRPGLLARYPARVLQVAQTSDQPEAQWHMAQLLARLPLTAAQRATARRTLRRYLSSGSTIVYVMALDALVWLAPDTPAGRAEVRRLLAEADRSSAPAVRA